jgi:predicted transcriptional regulator
MTIQTMLIAIHATGLNDYRIAERTGIAQSHIFKLRKGQLRDIRYERGKKIEALYNQIKKGESPCPAPTSRKRNSTSAVSESG